MLNSSSSSASSASSSPTVYAPHSANSLRPPSATSRAATTSTTTNGTSTTATNSNSGQYAKGVSGMKQRWEQMQNPQSSTDSVKNNSSSPVVRSAVTSPTNAPKQMQMSHSKTTLSPPSAVNTVTPSTPKQPPIPLTHIRSVSVAPAITISSPPPPPQSPRPTPPPPPATVNASASLSPPTAGGHRKAVSADMTIAKPALPPRTHTAHSQLLASSTGTAASVPSSPNFSPVVSQSPPPFMPSPYTSSRPSISVGRPSRASMAPSPRPSPPMSPLSATSPPHSAASPTSSPPTVSLSVSKHVRVDSTFRLEGGSSGSSSSTGAHSTTSSASLSSADPTSKARLKVQQDLVASEEKYIHHLNSLMTVYFNPLKAKADKGTSAKITPADFTAMFSNVEKLWRMHTIIFLPALKACVSAKDGGDIASVFLTHGDNFLIYREYSPSLDTITRLHKNDDFVQFMNKQKSNPASEEKDLMQFLTMPIQRVPRYIQFLKDLQKQTPKQHPHSVSVDAAIEKMTNLISKVMDSTTTRSASASVIARPASASVAPAVISPSHHQRAHSVASLSPPHQQPPPPSFRIAVTAPQ